MPAIAQLRQQVAELEEEMRTAEATASGLKISSNGTFGKLGSPYSCLYSPALLIQVTVTGQLALLMLIEALEAEGIRVVSANTDGVTVWCPVKLQPMLDLIVWDWEHHTGFVTEEVRYRALYSRDISNYVAVKMTDGEYKAKGVFATTSLNKNPQNEIIADAVIAYLVRGTPVADTVCGCQDIRKFISVRTVNGGAVAANGVHLGRVARWYHSTQVDGAISYAINGYKVPLTDRGRAVPTLPDHIPDDLDRERYVGQALDALRSLGVEIEEQALA